MRLKNSGKSAAAQKTPPARKTSARAAQKTPESNTEVETPKIAETRRGSAAKGKQVKVAASDDKLEQTLADEAKASTDAAEEMAEVKVVSGTKSAGKRSAGKTRTPPSRGVLTRRAARSAEAAKMTAEGLPIVETSTGEGCRMEAITGNSGESAKQENSSLNTIEADCHTAARDCIKNDHCMIESVKESLEQRSTEYLGEIEGNKQATSSFEVLPKGNESLKEYVERSPTLSGVIVGREKTTSGSEELPKGDENLKEESLEQQSTSLSGEIGGKEQATLSSEGSPKENETLKESLVQRSPSLFSEILGKERTTLGSEEFSKGLSCDEMAERLTKDDTADENIDESEKEGNAMEVDGRPTVNSENSSKQDKSLKDDVILAESKQPGAMPNEEGLNNNGIEGSEHATKNIEVLKEGMEGGHIIGKKEVLNDEPSSANEAAEPENPKAAQEHEYGGDDMMKGYGDQVNFEPRGGLESAEVNPDEKYGQEPEKEDPEDEKEEDPEYNPEEEHAKKELLEDIQQEEPVENEPAEDDAEKSLVETETLEEEHRELLAMAKERQKKKECEIFVGSLDHDASEEDVKKVFEKIGEVVEVQIPKNPSTNKNKGYAFVRFSDKDCTKRALNEMKNPFICGKQCRTAPSEDNDTLFLGNICNTWTKEAVRQKLKDYGVEGVENITLVPDAPRDGLSRGFAFLQFSSHAEATHAYKRLQKPDAVFGHPERSAKVAFAEPQREPDPEIMAQVKSVFIDGLPPEWDENQIKEKLKVHGEIVRIVLARNMSTARRKDFGFVDFSTHDSAVACIDAINNTRLGDANSKTKLKARLSNPLPKTQAVKGGMCGGFRIGRGSVGTLPKFERARGRGVHSGNRAPFQFGRGGRGLYQGGRGHSERMGIPHPSEHGFDYPYADYPGRQILGRGGRRPPIRGNYHMSPTVANSSRSTLDRPWTGVPGNGRGGHFPPWRQPYPPEAHFDRPLAGRNYEDPYLYDDTVRGIKRPPFMTDREFDYMEPPRLRPRLDYSDHAAPLYGNRYPDSFGASGSLHPHNYYGSDYGRGHFSSYPGGDHSFAGRGGGGRGYYH